MRFSAVAVALMLSSPALVAARDVVVPVEEDAPVALAARDKVSAKVRALLDATPHADVIARTADGTSALHWAVYHNYVDLVTRLIAAGADVNARNDYGA